MPPKKRKTRRRSSKRRQRKGFHFPWVKISLSLLLVVAGYVGWLDYQVYHQFEGRRWSLPARVYARPLELYAGLSLRPHSSTTNCAHSATVLSPARDAPGKCPGMANAFS